MPITMEQRRYLMGVAMFLMFMPMGMWLPALPNILNAYDAGWALPYVFALMPTMGIFSSLLFASLSDRNVEAQKLLGILSLVGAVFLWLAFSSLKWGWHAGWYLLFKSCTALISAPMIPLITKIKLANLKDPEKSFPLYSMCGSLGWLSAGILVSALGLDTSANAGCLAAYLRVLLGLVCFLLPATLPEGNAGKGLKAALGLEAFGILKNKELRVFYIASTLISIAYIAFFMYVPIMLKDFGSEYPTAQMTLGQFVEIFAMVSLSLTAGRFRNRTLLMISMFMGVLRFSFFVVAGITGWLPFIWLGIALHGPIYVFMTVTGRIFVDRRVQAKLRGQAQALYSLLTLNIAGILGSVFCAFVYRQTVLNDTNSWTSLWLVMVVFAITALAYFIKEMPSSTSRNF